MPTLEECLLSGRTITIDRALEIRRSSGPNQPFECPECKERVRPHSAGGHAAAHFEHRKRNPECSKSHPLPQ